MKPEILTISEEKSKRKGHLTLTAKKQVPGIQGPFKGAMGFPFSLTGHFLAA